MTIPADFTRCLDDGCPERHECLRWLERETAGGPSWATHCPSLFPYDVPLGKPCPMRIPPENKSSPALGRDNGAT